MIGGAVAALVVAHLALVAAVVPHAWASRHGRDVATYYYAAQAAAHAEDPYARSNLERRAAREGTRRSVFPLLYPPTFLLVAIPLTVTSLFSAYLLAFLLNELAALAVVLALALGWRDQQTWLGLVGLAVVALGSCVPNNALMGQLNLPVLALTLGALALVRRGRWRLGGALLALAVALKLAPIVLLGWWMLRGRWRPALAASLGLLVLGLASIAWLGVGPWLTYLTEVLPSLRSGAYNDLGLPIGLFGNHSLPDVWRRLAPGSDAMRLSVAAQAMNTVAAVTLGGAMVVLWRRSPRDAMVELAQASALMVAWLLLSVFTYEHHLVWAVPGFTVAGGAVIAGRLSRVWGPPLLVAAAAWAVDLEWVRAAAVALGDPVGPYLPEIKLGALIVLFGSLCWLGAGRSVVDDQPR